MAVKNIAQGSVIQAPSASRKNSHVLFIVPIQYEAKLKESQVSVYAYPELWDGNLTTSGYIDGNTTHDLQIVTASNARWCYLSQVSGMNKTAWNIKDGTTQMNVVSGYNEIGKNDFIFSSSGVKRSRASEDYSDCLFEFLNNNYRSRFSLNASGVATGVNAKGIVFSKNFNVRMFDQDYSIEYSFDDDVISTRNSHGIITPSYLYANLNQVQKTWTFKWTELFSGEYSVFEDFFKAFDNCVTQPFYLCVIHGTAEFSGMMTPLYGVINSQTIDISKKDDTYYNVSFSMREIIKPY